MPITKSPGSQPFPKQGGYLLLARASSLLPLIAARAGQGEVFVLDGGNRFNAFEVIRFIRFQTCHLYEWQERIHLARAFTSHEMTALLAHTPATTAPVFVLDLLATFYDDAVTDSESIWQLRLCLRQLQRLQKNASVLINLPHSPHQERPALVNLLRRSLKSLSLESIMGKTIPTANDLIRELEAILSNFRKVLCPAQRVHLDALIIKAKQHTTAISNSTHLLPFETILLASLLEQESEHAELTARLTTLERKLSQLENKR